MGMQRIKQLADKNGITSVLYNLPRLLKGYQPIYLDYPVKAIPRYGYGRPVHPELAAILDEHRELYKRTLSEFLQFTGNLIEIPLSQPNTSKSPSWLNPWLSGLDAFALYGFIAAQDPSMYIEVGSGFSTKIVRKAISDHRLRTKIVSIDPHPRAEINIICDQVIRQPLEDCDLSILNELKSGDVFFLDSSHRSFMNSDVTVFFLEILPRLAKGVLVHIHDIHLPKDYMPEQSHWFYSEQYLLAASLLAGHSNFEVLLPNSYISKEHELSSVLDQFWSHPHMAEVPHGGCSFWIRTR
jgi:hypothetical protein